MAPALIPATHTEDYSRCEERRRVIDHGISLSSIQNSDSALRESIYAAIWRDSVLRAIEHDEIDVRVHMGIVHLYGHIVSHTNQIRVMNAIQTIPGILGIQSDLVFDDRLTLEVAASLGNMEHTYECKFFTGASHGVISLDGIVRDESVKLLAEKQVSGNPKVRGVINHVRVESSGPELLARPFLQPVIGETIYFLDGISGIVKQVVINPDNRRVIAMTLQGRFTDQRLDTNSITDAISLLPEQQVLVPMSMVRYLTRISGYLYIKSSERTQYLDFDSTSFGSPGLDWVPPYPYCTDDVLFPMEQQDTGNHSLQQISRPPFTAMPKEKLLREQLLTNDSLGG